MPSWASEAPTDCAARVYSADVPGEEPQLSSDGRKRWVTYNTQTGLPRLRSAGKGDSDDMARGLDNLGELVALFPDNGQLCYECVLMVDVADTEIESVSQCPAQSSGLAVTRQYLAGSASSLLIHHH